MRVALVVQAEAWPARSGIGRRIEALHDELSRHHEVTVIACLPATSAATGPQGSTYLRVSRPPGGARALPRMLLAALTGRPLTTTYYVARSSRRGLAAALREAQPEVVVAQGIASAMLAGASHPPSRTFVDLADAEHERVGALGRSGGWRKVPYRWDGPRMAAWLGRNLERFAAVSVVSRSDLESHQALAPRARLLLCPNGASVRPAPRPDPGGGRLLFLGDLHYPPNATGLRWFAEEVLPLLEGVTLRVVGRGAPPRSASIQAAGFVPDLDPEWDQAVALVVPLFAGGGTRLKAVEALGAGVPVVSTTVGVAGLDLQHGEDCLTADSAEEMAREIRTLLADGEARERLGRAGHRAASERFAWRQCWTSLREELARLAR